MPEFLKELNGELMLYKEVVSFIAAAIGIIALFFTAIQIRRNSKQIKANSIYEIQKDARIAASELFENKGIYKSMLAKEMKMKDKSYHLIGKYFNFYASVYQQRRLNVIDGRIWKPFLAEMQQFLEMDLAKKFWKKKKGLGQYDKGFTKLVNKLIEKQN